MTLPMGRLITGDAGRDAVHVAIAPTTAPCELRPGQHVDAHGNPEGPGACPVGVVDPFLHDPVRPGERFWLFLYPNSVTSLRHEWTHPAYPTATTGEVNRAVLDYLERRTGRAEL
jgi:hypothetical protein